MKCKPVSREYLKFEGIIEDRKVHRLSNKIRIDGAYYFVIDDGYFTINKKEYDTKLKIVETRKDLINKLDRKYGNGWCKKHKINHIKFITENKLKYKKREV